jgi:phenylalanyl-tRNA synthetase beta chain
VALMPAGEHAGWLGLLADNQTKAFDVTQPLAAGELNLDLLARQSAAPRRCPPLPAMPAVLRDVALVVDENVAWAELAAFVDGWRAREPLRDPREPLRFLSVFRGKQVGAGKKSVAFSIVYRAADRSLTDEEVNAAQQRFVDALLKKFRAALRM